jgi:hypothetical protein
MSDRPATAVERDEARAVASFAATIMAAGENNLLVIFALISRAFPNISLRSALFPSPAGGRRAAAAAALPRAQRHRGRGMTAAPAERAAPAARPSALEVFIAPRRGPRIAVAMQRIRFARGGSYSATPNATASSTRSARTKCRPS